MHDAAGDHEEAEARSRERERPAVPEEPHRRDRGVPAGDDQGDDAEVHRVGQQPGDEAGSPALQLACGGWDRRQPVIDQSRRPGPGSARSPRSRVRPSRTASSSAAGRCPSGPSSGGPAGGGAAPGRRSARRPGRPPCPACARPAIPSDATDPVESRMSCGRSMPTTTSSARLIRSIRPASAVRSSRYAMASMSRPRRHPIQVDPRHHQLGQIQPIQHRLDVQAPGHPIQIDPRHHQLGQIQPIQHRLDVQAPGHPIQIDPRHHQLGQIQPIQHRLDVQAPGHPIQIDPRHHQLGQIQPIQHRCDQPGHEIPEPALDDRPGRGPLDLSAGPQRPVEHGRKPVGDRPGRQRRRRRDRCGEPRQGVPPAGEAPEPARRRPDRQVEQDQWDVPAPLGHRLLPTASATAGVPAAAPSR